MSAGRPLEVVDKSVHLLIWRCPVKLAIHILDIAIE
jgi:hypothetical protein